MNASGNWDDATKWTSSNIGDAITENVTLSGNTSPTVRNGFSYTIGDLSAGGDNTITIEGTGSLTLGASGNPKNLSMTGNNPKLTVRGTLIIWGNVTFTNKVVWEIRGTVIIKGNLLLNGGANLDVKNGALLQVEGNLTGGNNTDVTVNGSGGVIKVFQDVNVGSGNLNGGGSFEYGGTCTSSNVNFCNNADYNGTLPIELLYIRAVQENEGMELAWATASEHNFDRFIIEHSIDGKHFQAIGEQQGAGESNTTKIYSFFDSHPVIGKNYYRLRSVDFDLAYDYSSIVFAEFEDNKEISLYPNPLMGPTIHLAANFELQEGDKIQIIDPIGTIFYKASITETTQTLDLENDLKPGIYILEYTSQGYEKQIRFTKD
jgi:hypothetical protein